MKFADTGWWVAWALPGDRQHADALAMVSQLGNTEQVLATNHIVGETWTFLRRRADHRTAVAFLDRIEHLVADRRMVRHMVTADQEQAAMAWLRRHDEREYSFVDATSFRVMRDRRLTEALAFDQNFAAAGFIEVQPRRG